jgi:hypothetical protein
MINTQKSIGTGEVRLNHKLGWTPASAKPKDPPRNYFVPNFGQDNEINENKESLKLAESMIGHTFDFPNAKWKNPAKDTDYNFRMALDEDVISTQKNLADSENKLGHHWVIDA